MIKKVIFKPKYTIIALILVISIPSIIGQLLRIPLGEFTIGDEGSWVSFWGSYIGGIAGAFGAFLIARYQVTKQLNLQDEKDRNRILLEVKLRKAEGILDTSLRSKATLFSLHGAWHSMLLDYGNFISTHWKEKVDYESLKNEGIIQGIEKNRDAFILTYSECYKYKPYFEELISMIKQEHDEKFKDLTLEINDVIARLSGVDSRYTTYEELWKSIEIKITSVNSRFEVVHDCIEEHIVKSEETIALLMSQFEK